MNREDYIDGTTYILLRRSQFKSENEWESICSFLCLPTDTNRIKIYVDKGSYEAVWDLMTGQ
jgi:hypothetical protein